MGKRREPNRQRGLKDEERLRGDHASYLCPRAYLPFQHPPFANYPQAPLPGQARPEEVFPKDVIFKGRIKKFYK